MISVGLSTLLTTLHRTLELVELPVMLQEVLVVELEVLEVLKVLEALEGALFLLFKLYILSFSYPCY